MEDFIVALAPQTRRKRDVEKIDGTRQSSRERRERTPSRLNVDVNIHIPTFSLEDNFRLSLSFNVIGHEEEGKDHHQLEQALNDDFDQRRHRAVVVDPKNTIFWEEAKKKKKKVVHARDETHVYMRRRAVPRTRRRELGRRRRRCKRRRDEASPPFRITSKKKNNTRYTCVGYGASVKRVVERDGGGRRVT